MPTISKQERSDWFRVAQTIEGLRQTVQNAAEGWQQPSKSDVYEQLQRLHEAFSNMFNNVE